MPKNILIAGLGVLLALMAASSSQAAIVANYTFTGGVLTSSVTDPNSSATSISLGSGIPNSGVSLTIGNPAESFRFAAGDIGNHLNTSDYIEFTVTAGSGLVLDLSSLTFQTSAQSASDTGRWAVRTGTFINDLADDLISGTEFFDGSINLSSIADTPSITFRFYAWNDPGDQSDLYFDNIVLHATAIPEVGTVWASLLVLGAAIVIKQRFDKSNVPKR